MGKRCVKLTTEEFIQKCNSIHNDRFDYSGVDYGGASKNVRIRCVKHDVWFEQTPSSHYKSKGCPECVAEHRKQVKRNKTAETFVTRAQATHGDRFDYSLTVYTGAEFSVKIGCRQHGFVFEQKPFDHLAGKVGCKYCIANYRKTLEDFLQKAGEVHGDKYDYSDIVFRGMSTPVKIYCRKHQKLFSQTPSGHVAGRGCPNCANESRNKERVLKAREEFENKATVIHGDKYSYEKVIYINSSTKVCIFCKACGVYYEQTPSNHLAGHGHENCKSSEGERVIKEFLKRSEFPFERQKRFPDCKYIKTLPFDFYLPEKDLLCEYHGEQHYMVIPFFGGQSGFILRQIRDMIKKNYCKLNNIRLLEIPYWDFDNIEAILKKELLYERG